VSSAVIYEVNIRVAAAIETDYRAWLVEHIAAMLALPGFVRAHCFDVLDPAPAPGFVALCVHYHLRDAQALQAYFEQYAAGMRADGITRFGDNFSASRRVLRECHAAGCVSGSSVPATMPSAAPQAAPIAHGASRRGLQAG
jgi:hypothetical protein